MRLQRDYVNYKKHAAGGQMQSGTGSMDYGSIASGVNGLVDTIDQGNSLGRKSTGSYALKGAASGAAAGSVAGPWGTAVGAVVGAGVGLIAGGSAKRKENRYLAKQKQIYDQTQQQQSMAVLGANPELMTGYDGGSGSGYYANGGPLNDPNKPTRSDSLAVYNNSQKLSAYYSKYKFIANDPILNDNVETFHEKARQDVAKNAKIGFKIATPQGQRTVPMDEYYKKVDDNRYMQRENATGVIDTRAPVGFYDKRIRPQYLSYYTNEDAKDRMNGDIVNIAQYDPIAVKPWDMLTPQERVVREKKYGKNPVGSVPVPAVNKPMPTSRLKPIVSTPTKLPIKKTSLPPAAPIPAPVVQVTTPSPIIPAPASTYQMKGNSVFGPNKALIGTRDGNDFYPDYDNTAKRTITNQGDIDLLNDNTKLQSYLKTKGISSPTIKPQFAYGGNLEPMSKTSVDVHGPSHAEGGVKIGSNEVEGKETIDNGYVFSARLGFADVHRPLAKALGKIEEKPYNQYSAAAATRIKGRISKLKETQEFVKSQLNLE